MSLEEAKTALDKIIRIGRVHLYKPIQIAEILHKHRTERRLNLTNLEDYRNLSKRWRDEVSLRLVGRISTSSARYQDDVFNDNAMPPNLLAELGQANVTGNGIVEAYIYSNFEDRHEQLSQAMTYVRNSTPVTFHLQDFLAMFRTQAGLKRSIDKVYEAVVYALFNTIVHALRATITLNVSDEKSYLVEEFEDFTRVVLGIDTTSLSYTTEASLYRVGVTNAADRGLDMWANFGPAIQVKHLTLDISMAENIVGSVSADRIVIVCRDCERETLQAILRQIGWGDRIQGIIVESKLINWYNKALVGDYFNELADSLLEKLLSELESEFPSYSNFNEFYTTRGYDRTTLEGIWNER